MADPGYIVDGVLTDGEAWVGIATVTLGSAASVVTFTSTDDGQVGDWSQYMDLFIVCYLRDDRSGVNGVIGMAVNNDTTGSNYSMQRLYGYAGSASTNSGSGGAYAFGEIDAPATSSPVNVFGIATIHCFDINSGKYKSNLLMSCAEGWETSSGWIHIQANTWLNQAPITEFDFVSTYGSNIVAGSKFSLFGILPRMVA